MDEDLRRSLRQDLMFKSGKRAKMAGLALLKANVSLKDYEANRIAELLMPEGKKPKGQLQVRHFFWSLTADKAIEAGKTKTEAIEAVMEKFKQDDERSVRRVLKKWGVL